MGRSKESTSLRPREFEDFIGQEPVKEVLKVAIEAARKQDRALDHVLLNGPPGLGKTTLARIIAREMKWKVKTTIGSSVKTANDVQSLAFSIPQKGKVILFVDEVHRVGKPAQEVLYPILEDGIYFYKVGYSITEWVMGPLTVIGATTNAGRLQQPFVDRFGLQFQLEYYTGNEMAEIVARSMEKIGVCLGEDALWEVVSRSRATPRIANRMLMRLRDYNIARGIELTQNNVAGILWKKFHTDIMGLEALDRKVLRILDKAVGPVGVETIAAMVNEDAETIESRVEPYLLRMGLVDRHMRGRVITEAGRGHIRSFTPGNAGY
jgi:Holliday junction DNA helicase RuvB